jgi:L-2-hydroxycarboxylate dehydrogenase (NAD+)
MQISVQDAKVRTVQLLVKEGVRQEDAEITTDVLIEADIQGHLTHGLSRLGYYIKRIRDGIILTDTEPEVVRKTPAITVLNGKNGLGQVIATKATDFAIVSAQKTGIGACAVRNSSHYGIAGYYSLRCAEKNLVGIAFTNARPAVAPTHSNIPKLGTNPYAISMPSDYGFPFHIDCATSALHRGALEVLARSDKPVNLQSYVTCPECTPSEILSKIEEGTCALKPIGEHKGYGLSVAIELFSSAFQTGSYMTQLSGFYEGGPKKPYNIGHFFLCLDPSAFVDIETFRKNVTNVMKELKTAGHMVLIPGEPEFLSRMEAEENGLEFPEELHRELVALGW